MSAHTKHRARVRGDARRRATRTVRALHRLGVRGVRPVTVLEYWQVDMRRGQA